MQSTFILHTQPLSHECLQIRNSVLCTFPPQLLTHRSTMHINRKGTLLQELRGINWYFIDMAISCPSWTGFLYAPEDTSRKSSTPFALFLRFSSRVMEKPELKEVEKVKGEKGFKYHCSGKQLYHSAQTPVYKKTGQLTQPIRKTASICFSILIFTHKAILRRFLENTKHGKSALPDLWTLCFSFFPIYSLHLV